jgi:hypothetical protein
MLTGNEITEIFCLNDDFAVFFIYLHGCMDRYPLIYIRNNNIEYDYTTIRICFGC